jgi:hypothetical protein
VFGRLVDALAAVIDGAEKLAQPRQPHVGGASVVGTSGPRQFGS